MNEPEKMIDLNPREWRSEREKPREPIFGPGLPGALAYVVAWIVTFSAIYYFTH